MRREYAVYKLCALTTRCTGRVPAARAGELNTLGRHPNMREENHEQSIRQHWT
jgi:hypothetical protein